MILGNLVGSEDFIRRVGPHLEASYFADPAERAVFGVVDSHFRKYNRGPSREALAIQVADLRGLGEEDFERAISLVESLEPSPVAELDWAVDQAEEFCKRRALHGALVQSLRIFDGEEKDSDVNAIPSILEEALGVSFDVAIGHDFVGDAVSRYEMYTQNLRRLPFRSNLLNRITRGGLPDKTLNCIMAPTGVGKTLIMCSFAADWLMDGHDVLYITGEMAEERIAERIDANLLDIALEDLPRTPRATYMSRLEKIRSKTRGNLVVKEFPTGGCSAAHVRHLCSELRLKRKFVPRVILVDYLNIMASSRLKMSHQSVNSYTWVKAIAEEFRGLAVELGIPVVTATQTNRTGAVSSDLDVDDVSDSFGLPMTVDMLVGVNTTEELDELGQQQWKQIKNRYSDPAAFRRFVMGVDKSKMRVFDPEPSAQRGLMDDSVTPRTQGRPDDDRGRFDGFT
jgi:replicative DNA helicase